MNVLDLVVPHARPKKHTLGPDAPDTMCTIGEISNAPKSIMWAKVQEVLIIAMFQRRPGGLDRGCIDGMIVLFQVQRTCFYLS